MNLEVLALHFDCKVEALPSSKKKKKKKVGAHPSSYLVLRVYLLLFVIGQGEVLLEASLIGKGNLSLNGGRGEWVELFSSRAFSPICPCTLCPCYIC